MTPVPQPAPKDRRRREAGRFSLDVVTDMTQNVNVLPGEVGLLWLALRDEIGALFQDN